MLAIIVTRESSVKEIFLHPREKWLGMGTVFNRHLGFDAL
jgi:hypothetical protein